MRLLLIDDDDAARHTLASGLLRHGFLSDEAPSLAAAHDMMATVEYGAILLDCGVGHDGAIALLRDMRRQRLDVPVLVVAADAGPRQCAAMLDAGADDHVAAPADPDELAAHVRALLRRGPPVAQALGVGGIAYDPRTLELTIGARPAVVSARERQLVVLLLLLRGGGRVVTRAYIEDQLFGHNEALGSNAIEVYVHRLRRRLHAAGATARIETVRGVGYLLRDGGLSGAAFRTDA